MPAPQTLILTQREIARVVDMATTIRVTRQAFIAMAKGQTIMPSKVYLTLPSQDDFRAMPAYLARPAASGMKWVNVHRNNPKRGLPTVMAVIVINDPATGAPIAVMDGLLITKLRTAAAGAVAAAALARPDSRIAGLVGCGGQADAQIEALSLVMRRLTTVRVWGYGRGEAAAFARRMRRRLPRLAFEPAAQIEQAVRGADVLVTLTPSRKPLVKRAWISPGTHINAIGADAPGKQELDPAILRHALVVVDEREQALHGGELNVPVAKGQFTPSEIHASLGEVLTGKRRGRRSATEVTVFDSTGLAIHDVALGSEVVRRARARKVGRAVQLWTS